ncbi:MAG TPA: FAD-dependent thymidylate synthase [Lentisphaeria bacterium]|nr:MAG: thymidylate synthase, flavin-dependent [Lentisphaerae bacterium GWF2_38_69]HBM17037.1 FAD-dependent thymidylate synthase [Lentisphaeria bacterium]
MLNVNLPPEKHVKVLGDQGWIGLIDMMGTEATIVNAARVSFGKIKQTMDDKDIELLKYLIENKHTSPLEHIVFTFSVHCPLFVRGQWHRHRTWSYNEISRRYTDFDLTFYVPSQLREQSKSNRQASVEGSSIKDSELKAQIDKHNKGSLDFYNYLISKGVCREQARGVLPQNMMVTFWATVDLSNLLHFLELRDHSHAQWEIREYGKAIKELIAPYLPNLAKYLKW